MTTKLPKIAFVYDFDGTLLQDNGIDYQLLPDLGATKVQDFWKQNNEKAAKAGADQVCWYMYQLAKLAKKKKRPLSKKSLSSYGKALTKHFHKGLLSGSGSGSGGKDNDCWFDRIARKCKSAGLSPVHYIVSSGLAELIEASAIAKKVDGIYASRYHFDQDGLVDWPAVVINYTNKTQYLFRINKGALKETDDEAINSFVPEKERPIPFSQMVVIGDGFTDVPCFSLVKGSGGFAIAILNGEKDQAYERIESLVADRRVDTVSLVRHYEKGSTLDRSIERIIKKVAEKAKQ